MINMWEIYIKSMNIEIKDYLMLIHVQFEINQFCSFGDDSSKLNYVLRWWSSWISDLNKKNYP